MSKSDKKVTSKNYNSNYKSNNNDNIKEKNAGKPTASSVSSETTSSNTLKRKTNDTDLNKTEKNNNNNSSSSTNSTKKEQDNKVTNNNNNSNKKQKNDSILNESANGWDGLTPIESLTLGELIATLNGKHFDLRIQAAEYLFDNRVTGFTEKIGFLLNWTFEKIVSSYNNWRRRPTPNIVPLCYDMRYWNLLKRLLERRDNTNSVYLQLSSEYLISMLEILLNSILNFESNTSSSTITTADSNNNNKIKKYQLSSSSPPPLDLLVIVGEILNLSIGLFLPVDIYREVSQFFEAIHPNLIKSLQNNNNNSSIEIVLSIINQLLEYILHQIKLGNNSKQLQTIVLNILPYLLTYQHSLKHFNNNNNIKESPSSSLSINTITSLLQWTLYHPDSHWKSYPAVLLSGWINNDKSGDSKKKSKQPQPTTNNQKENEKETKEKSQFQSQIILEQIEQLISNENLSKSIKTYKDIPLSHVILDSLGQLLHLFTIQFNQYGKKHITNNDIFGNSSNNSGSNANPYANAGFKSERLLEFAYFRKLYLLFLNEKMQYKPELIKFEPLVYFEALANLLSTLASLNIFYQDNQQQVEFLQNQLQTAVKVIQNNKTEQVEHGIYKLLTSFVKISHVTLNDKLETIFHQILLSPFKSNHSDEFLCTLLDTYLSIRQSDNLLEKLINNIISGKIRSIQSNRILSITIQDKFANHFNGLPFGQVPLIWDQFIGTWRDYFIFQLNEDIDIRDPILIDRLNCFTSIWSRFLDNIQMTSFVTQKLSKLLDDSYSLIVDPVLNLISKLKKSKKTSASDEQLLAPLLLIYSSFSQLHSYIHRLAIASEEQGINEYHYHPQHFHYYQLYEEQLESSKSIEYLTDKIQSANNNNNNSQLHKTIIILLLYRIQQLNSLLTSCSNPIPQLSKEKELVVSSFKKCSPVDINRELCFLVKLLLDTMLNQDDSNQSLDDESQWKLILENICIWSNYTPAKQTQQILSKIISPNSKNTVFSSVLTNSQFYELNTFRKQLPVTLTLEIKNIIDTLFQSKSTQKKINSIFGMIYDRLNGDGSTLNETVKQITSIQTSISASSIKLPENSDDDDDISKELISQWDRLTYLLSLLPAMNINYIEEDCIASITLLTIVVELVLKSIDINQIKDKLSLSIYNCHLSNLKLLRYCLQRDLSRMVSLVPLDTWLNITFLNNNSSNNDKKQMLNQNNNEIQWLVATDLWENHPMEFSSVLEKTLQKNGVESIGILLKSIVDSIENGFKKSLPTNLEKLLDDKSISKSIKKSIGNIKEEIDNKDGHQLQSIVYYVWLSIARIESNQNNSSMSRIERQDIPSEIADQLNKLLHSIQLFIQQQSKDTVELIPLALQSSIVSLMELYVRVTANLLLNKRMSQDDTVLLTALLIHLASCYPAQSRFGQRLMSAIVHLGQHNQIDQFLPLLTTLLENDRVNIHRSQLLAIVNQLLNIGISITPTSASNLFNACIHIVIQSAQDIINSNNNQQQDNNKKSEYKKVLNASVILISKLIDHSSEQSLRQESLQNILTTVMVFEGAFVYSQASRSLNSYQTAEDTLDMLPMDIISSNNNIRAQLSSTSPTITTTTKRIPLDGESYSNLCRLLFFVQRIRSKNFIKLLSPFISCIRCLLFGLANEEYQLDDRCARSLSRLLEEFSKHKEVKNYLHYIILDYIKILTYQQPQQKSNTTRNNKNIFKPIQYYLTTDIRKSLQPGLISVFSNIDKSIQEQVFKTLDDESKGHFKTLYELQQSDKYSGK